MIPQTLLLRNFMCYRDELPPLDFAGIQIACLSGENGAGKSALLDAMTWALWGEARLKSDDDLIALLDSGHLAGATLDVFRTEPLPAGHPFWLHPKITVTPHTSARTLREETIAQIAGKIAAVERGEPIAGLPGVVDRQRGY